MHRQELIDEIVSWNEDQVTNYFINRFQYKVKLEEIDLVINDFCKPRSRNQKNGIFVKLQDKYPEFTKLCIKCNAATFQPVSSQNNTVVVQKSVSSITSQVTVKPAASEPFANSVCQLSQEKPFANAVSAQTQAKDVVSLKRERSTSMRDLSSEPTVQAPNYGCQLLFEAACRLGNSSPAAASQDYFDPDGTRVIRIRDMTEEVNVRRSLNFLIERFEFFARGADTRYDSGNPKDSRLLQVFSSACGLVDLDDETMGAALELIGKSREEKDYALDSRRRLDNGGGSEQGA